MKRKSFSSITHIHLITLFQIFSEVLLSFKFFLFFPDDGNIEAGITHLTSHTLKALRTFAPIVSAHPYCARLRAEIHMPRYASSERAKYQNEQ